MTGMKEVRSVPQGRGLIALYLDKEERTGICGLLRVESIGVNFRFSSLSSMAVLVEQMLDLPEEAMPGGGPAPSGNPDFEVDILFRQNYSWQGRFRRTGEGQWMSFHSALELLTFLESALTE